MHETEVREQLCRFARSLFDRGLTHGASGNVTVRLEDGGMLATPTNVSLGWLDPGALSRFDASGRLVDGPKPTKEMPLHEALYATRAATGAVVHLHSTHSVAVSMLGEVDPADVLPPLTAYYLMRVGRTALLPYHRPGDARVEARHSRSRRPVQRSASRQSRPGGRRGDARSRQCGRSRSSKKRRSSTFCCVASIRSCSMRPRLRLCEDSTLLRRCVAFEFSLS